MTSAAIPDSVTEIGKYAFEGCFNLKDIYYGGTYEQWNKISESGPLIYVYGYYVHCTDGDYPK